MRKLLAVVVVMLSLSGCWQSADGQWHPGNNPGVDRCAQLDQQNDIINTVGGNLRCDPSYEADEQSHCPPSYRCTFVMEWDIYTNGVRVAVAWVWQANLTDYWLAVYGWMGVCEMYAYRAGRIPDYYLNVQRDAVPPDIDRECFSWAVAQAA